VTHVEVNLARVVRRRPRPRGAVRTGRRAGDISRVISSTHRAPRSTEGHPGFRTRTSSRECASLSSYLESARRGASSALLPSASTMASTSCSPLPPGRHHLPSPLNFPPDICRALEALRNHRPGRRATLWIQSCSATRRCRRLPFLTALHHELGRRLPDRADQALPRKAACPPRSS